MEVGNHWKEWEVTELLGSGSFGKVFKIKRTGLNNFVEESALKVIRIPQNPSDYQSALSEGMDDESVSAYFESIVSELSNEFALMSRLKGNTNIVSFEDYEVVKIPDDFGWEIFIRMEYLTPLTTYIAQNDITVRDVARIGIDICKALEVCEQEKIIHRDIKPENIFVSSRGDYKLGDFGIAKRLENTSVSLTKKGTLSYMAPEVYKGQPYTSSVDIYSLGIVLYRLLNYNRNPFMPPYPERIQYHHREEARSRRMSGEPLPVPVSAPDDFARVILKACAYDPDDRFPDARSMRLALESIISGDAETLRLYLEQLPDPDKSTVTLAAPAPETGTKKTGWPASRKIAVWGAVLVALFAGIIYIGSLSGSKGDTNADPAEPEATEQEEETEAVAETETETAETSESDGNLSFPRYEGPLITVTNEDELKNAVRTASPGSTIEVYAGEYNMKEPLIISTDDIRLLGDPAEKPVLDCMIQIDSSGVMLQNLDLKISTDAATETDAEIESTGILCQGASDTYIKNTDVTMAYDSDHILYGVMVYSPVTMSGCTIDVSDSVNGNIAVGVGGKLTAEGNHFISNDVGFSVFGEGSSRNTEEELQEMAASNSFTAPTRVLMESSF